MKRAQAGGGNARASRFPVWFGARVRNDVQVLFTVSNPRSAASETELQQETHKFDALVDPPRTWRRLEVDKIARFLEFAQYLAEDMGRDRVIEILRDSTTP